MNLITLHLIVVFIFSIGEVALGDSNCRLVFKQIEGFLCIKRDFVQEFTACREYVQCAMLCSGERRCQAFSLADGPCRLFVFDKCSKSVRDCSCSRRGQVFVKRQPGLEPGELCPTGYGDDLCGVKYKVYFGMGTWWPSRLMCESDGHLTIMADVVDATEMRQIDWIQSNRGAGKTLWLGGLQLPGSIEPRGGWYWADCNITVDDSLWAASEPNDFNDYENKITRYFKYAGLTDLYEKSISPEGVVCECVSPFN